MTDGTDPAADRPAEDLEHVRFQRDSFKADLERVLAERDRYVAENGELVALLERVRAGEVTGDQLDLDAFTTFDDGGPTAGTPVDVGEATEELETLRAERDSYLEDLQRLTAEFSNYRRQADKRQSEASARGAGSLAERLLPVLDACDAALANGAEDVAPVRSVLVAALEKEGLERIDAVDAPFDPTIHEAVLREEADDVDTQVVAEVMRAGYVWNGSVLRAAMVKVRG